MNKSPEKVYGIERSRRPFIISRSTIRRVDVSLLQDGYNQYIFPEWPGCQIYPNKRCDSYSVNDETRLLSTSSVVLKKTPIEIQHTCIQVCRYIRVDVGRTYRPTRVFASSLRTELSNQSTIQRNKVSRRHTQRRKEKKTPCILLHIIPSCTAIQLISPWLLKLISGW